MDKPLRAELEGSHSARRGDYRVVGFGLTWAAQRTWGRINPPAAEELDAVSARCTELATQVTAAVWPDWIADRLRRAVAPALDLAYPDSEAVRLANLAGQIAKRTAEAEV